MIQSLLINFNQAHSKTKVDYFDNILASNKVLTINVRNTRNKGSASNIICNV